MIPLELHIKNFLSYGSQTQIITFEPYHLICLSGKNGHGKSALLDAITWAVWGCARKTGGAKNDEGLIRLGQSHMMVAFDFLVDSTRYRVRREYSTNGGKSQTHLDFGIVDPITHHLRSLTDKTIKTTQEKINHTLGLDYEGFTNSVFLKQGQSNEFSKKTAKERKDVLASLLGLHTYEELRKAAQEKHKEFSHKKIALTARKEMLEKELEQKTLLTQQEKNLHEHHATLKQQEETLVHTLQETTYELTTLATKKSELHKHTLALEHINSLLQTTLQDLRQRIERWRSTRKHKPFDLTLLQQQKVALQQQLNELQQSAVASLQKAEELAALTSQLKLREAEIQETYQKQLDTLHKNYTESAIHLAQHETKKHELSQQCELIASEITHIQNAIATLPLTAIAQKNITEKLFEKRKNYYHRYIQQGNTTKQHLKEVANKQELTSGSYAQCPVCEHQLTPHTQNKIAHVLATQEHFFHHRLQRFTRLITSLKAILMKDHASLEKLQEQDTFLKTAYKTLTTFKQQYAEKTAALQLLQQECIALTNKKNALITEKTAHEQRLTHLFHEDTLYQDLVIKKEICEKTKAAYSATHDTYTNIHNALTHIEQQEQIARTWAHEQVLQKERRAQISELCATIKKLTKDRLLHTKELGFQQNYLHTEQCLKERQTHISNDLAQLSTQKEAATLQLGALSAQITLLESKEKDFITACNTLAIIEQEIADYTALMQAFGKDGIQALLIEQAIPELEQEANALLSKLTDNQSHIMIDSLRDLKSGGTKETLDIKISDAIGIRPYEYFSGGEAFRIDFALRVALSKLLAKRAGTSLQTLIIDEGFGSQDEEGLNNIMDTLYKIQDDFAKIIIVSHLPSMKDQFPTHFVIRKTAQGSTITVLEQD